ncbi:MAG TPA: hypothetical protein V6C84_08620 [Coleofasciculaceae cyanobacterium]
MISTQFLMLGIFQAVLLACRLPVPVSVPQPPAPAMPTSRLSIAAIDAQPLPPLTTAEFSQLMAGARNDAQSWLDLAGLNKLVAPPPISAELAAFRQEWRSKNPEVAPYLGTWRDDGGSGVTYYLSVFPSNTPRQVCLLEFRQELRAAPEDLIAEEILSLSTATASNGQLLGSRLRTAASAFFQSKFHTGYDVEFMGVVGSPLPGLASLSPPALPTDFPQEVVQEVSQELEKRGCQLPDSPPSG